MAVRPVFSPDLEIPGVRITNIDFEWFPGFAKSQKQKSITALHKEANNKGIKPILEISSKSIDKLGCSLSSFNLCIETKNTKKITVECAFQGSKVFERGGPYQDLYYVDSISAKKDPRIRQSGQIIKFKIFKNTFPIYPNTFFYDWLYVNAIYRSEYNYEKIIKYNGFTDIEFNPKRSVNCQAYSAALFVSLIENSKLDFALKSPHNFLSVLRNEYNKFNPVTSQKGFFDRDF